jgi:class 3 adenylate cyclase
VKRIDGTSLTLDLMKFLEEAENIPLFQEFCRKYHKENELLLFLDISRFQEMNTTSAEQYNLGRSIFDSYFNLRSSKSVQVPKEISDYLREAYDRAIDQKLIPGELFENVFKYIKRILASSFSFYMDEKLVNDSLNESDLEDCMYCLKKFNMITRRKLICSKCQKTLCRDCVNRDISNFSGKVCDICYISSTFKNLFYFSYVDKDLPRPFYFIVKSQDELKEWIDSFNLSLKIDELHHNPDNLTSVHKEGWIAFEDLSSKNWVKRYAILKNRRMWFFEFELRGHIHLSQSVIHTTEMSPVLSKEVANYGGFVSESNFSYQMLLKPDERTYYIAADSLDEQNLWIEKISWASSTSSDGKESPYETVDQAMYSRTKNEESPSGLVALVFTDVEKSTTLWERKPDAMNEALIKHDAILREYLSIFKGYEVKTEGDAFMIAFINALDAVKWCLEVQKALLSCDWPIDLLSESSASRELNSEGAMIWSGLRVRMGIHYGEPNLRKNPITKRMDYFGPTVNRTARIANSAHGGQIICSQEVVDYVQDFATESFIRKISFKKLGEFPFKGISSNVEVFQISSKELMARQFPPLRIGEKD